MGSWITSVAELRSKLNDGPTDKLRYFKKLIGSVDGSNKFFKSFEFRRITDFSTPPAAPLGVYVNNSIVGVASDSPEIGMVTLSAAPAARSRVEAVYYIQFFTDAELNEFVTEASNWLGQGDDVTNTPGGLKPAIQAYATAEAYQKMANKEMENLSDTYRFEDSPDPDKETAMDKFQLMAESSRKEAIQMRDDHYKRQGQSNAPLWGNAGKGTRRVVPG